MAGFLDLTLTLCSVFFALAYLAWKFLCAKPTPACAAGGKSCAKKTHPKNTVILSPSLAANLKRARSNWVGLVN